MKAHNVVCSQLLEIFKKTAYIFNWQITSEKLHNSILFNPNLKKTPNFYLSYARVTNVVHCSTVVSLVIQFEILFIAFE